MPNYWYVISGIAFGLATLCLLVSGYIFARILGQILPLLSETHNQIQDLGDLSANTVGRASETMELVEMRVSQTMGQATQAGKAATQQALGVGTALAGLYMAARLMGLVRNMWRSHRGK
jgi:hypothetical protein